MERAQHDYDTDVHSGYEVYGGGPVQAADIKVIGDKVILCTQYFRSNINEMRTFITKYDITDGGTAIRQTKDFCSGRQFLSDGSAISGFATSLVAVDQIENLGF
jgi:hypothetical protein